MQATRRIAESAGFIATLLASHICTAEIFSIPIIDTSGLNKGTARIVNNPFGPDELTINMTGLPVNTRYTVFMAQSSTPGALPVGYLGEFTSAGFALNPALGANATFSATAEIVNAFGSHNASLENALGISDIPAAGALANGATTYPLNWIRIYLATGTLSVFGTSESNVGGGFLFRIATPVPASAPVVAYLRGGTRRELSAGFSPAFTAEAAGNIVQYTLTQMQENGTVLLTRTQTSPFFGGSIAPQGCPGVRERWQLRVVDASGRSDSFEQLVTYIRDPAGGGIGFSCP